MIAGAALVVGIVILIVIIHIQMYSEAAIDYKADGVYRNYHRGSLGKAYNAGWEREKRRQIIKNENIEHIMEENK